MLRSIKEMEGYHIKAKDGELGKVETFLFDERIWLMVYMDVNIGGWLENKEVLISPHAIMRENRDEKVLETDLTKKLIRDSPNISSHEPISRKKEREYLDHYAWPIYWQASGFPAMKHMVAESEANPRESGMDDEKDMYLRSAKEVRGYKLHALKSRFGHMEDIIVDDETWMMRYLVVDTKDFIPHKKVLISPKWVDDISWDMKEVSVDISEDAILGCPEYDPAKPVNRDYENRLFDYYGRPKYWKVSEGDYTKGKPKKI